MLEAVASLRCGDGQRSSAEVACLCREDGKL